jgi:HEAT repeat protein
MTFRLSRAAWRCAVAWLAALAGAALAAAPAGAAAPLFDLAERSELIALGTVRAARSFEDGKLRVFDIEPERVLKGEAPPAGPVRLVQRLLFETTTPLLETGTRTLVFAVPLPPYTIYREALPEGPAYVQWTEELDTAGDLVSLADPALIEPLATYLQVRPDPEASARHLAGLLASPVPRLRQGALAEIERREELGPLVDAGLLAPLPAFLADERVPLRERGEILVRLARAGAAGIGPVAEEVGARGGALRAAAVDALVTADRIPPETALLADAASDDPALRLAAVRGLGRIGSPAALDRIEAILNDDPSDEVKIAALRALAWAPSPRTVALLDTHLREGDRRHVFAASESLAAIATPEAIAALERGLIEGKPETRTASAFALKQSGTREGLKILHEQKEKHPDPEVQRLCRLALGEALEEHGHSH